MVLNDWRRVPLFSFIQMIPKHLHMPPPSLQRLIVLYTTASTHSILFRNTMTSALSMSANQKYESLRLHPELFQGEFEQGWMHEDALCLVESTKECPKSNQATEYLLNVKSRDGNRALLREEAPQVYSFNAFSESFLFLLNEELKHFYEMAEKHKIQVRRPNSMNNYGVILNEIGLRETITSLQQAFLWPLAKLLFPVQGYQFDDHHSFIVRYNADEDLGLDMHMDDSDVTFNVCLGEIFTGATLTFCGNFGSRNHRKSVANYTHEIGRAVMHLGLRRHGADDIESGTRVNMIVWNHNNKFRSSSAYYRSQNSRLLYEVEESVPDAVCLSYTHDRDFTHFRELPEAVRGKHLKGWCPPPGKEYPGFKAQDANSEL